MATWALPSQLPQPPLRGVALGDLMNGKPTEDSAADSDRSSASYLSVKGFANLFPAPGSTIDGPFDATASNNTQLQLEHPQVLAATSHSAQIENSIVLPPAAADVHAPRRKAQGYRKLWALVNSVKRGENVHSRSTEEVSVEELIRMIQQLPASASVVDALLPSLPYLDSRAAAALLKGLAKAGVGQRAVDIFDYLRELPASNELSQLCDIFTYTTMISQCNNHHQLRRAMELVAEMRSRAIPLNVHTYSALLNVCLKANELDLSLDVYARMLAEGVTPNLVTFNTLLDIFNKTGRWMDALKVLELLQHQNLRPEARTYNAIIATCNGAGRYAEAVRVYEVMTAAGVEPNGSTYNAALTSYARNNQLESALALLSGMGARGYERGVNSYSAVLAACESPGRWDLALKLLQQMQTEGLRPSSACLASAMKACLQGGEAARAEQLFDRLCSVCKPDASTFNCLVCVYCQLGKVREAANMLEVMLRSGQQVEISTFDVAIEACWETGVVPLQHVAQQLFECAQQKGLYKTVVVKQVCGEGYVLDLQLPGGPAHVTLLGLLLLLAELRVKACTLLTPVDKGSAKVLLRLPIKGQDVATLNHVVSSQLRAINSPFVSIEPLPPTALAAAGTTSLGEVSSACKELHFVAEVVAVSEWLLSAPVVLVLGQLSAKGMDSLLACQEDAQRQLKCRQAMVSVQSFEGNISINAKAIPAGVLSQRPEMVRLLLQTCPLLKLPEEVGHDAVQLVDRLLCSSSVGALAASLSGLELTAACLHIVSRRDMAAAPVCAAAFGVQPQQLLLAVSQVQQVLGSRGCVAISALRVLQLLLERMAVDNRDVASTVQASGQAMALMSHAAASASFIGCPPSLMACAVLYASRLAAGLLPAWPSALAALTGCAETHTGLQPFTQAAMQLLMEI